MTEKKGSKNDKARELIMTDQHVDDVAETSLVAYENRDVVRELTARLMMFHPAASEIGSTGMIQVAQLAIIMGASPLPGVNEIHAYTSGNRVIVQPGINYWMRRSIHYGGIFWVIPVRPMTPDERGLYDIEEDDLAAICIGCRSRELEYLQTHGLTLDAASESTRITGLGVVGRERWSSGKDYKERKAGRPLIWTAIKRAETDFYKKAFPFIPGEKVPAGLGMALTASGEYIPKFDRQWQELGDPGKTEYPPLIEPARVYTDPTTGEARKTHMFKAPNTPDEMGAAVNEDGDIIDITPGGPEWPDDEEEPTNSDNSQGAGEPTAGTQARAMSEELQREHAHALGADYDEPKFNGNVADARAGLEGEAKNGVIKFGLVADYLGMAGMLNTNGKGNGVRSHFKNWLGTDYCKLIVDTLTERKYVVNMGINIPSKTALYIFDKRIEYVQEKEEVA